MENLRVSSDHIVKMAEKVLLDRIRHHDDVYEQFYKRDKKFEDLARI